MKGNIDGATKVYAVLGSPVRHSLSPAMHNASFEALGMNAVYVPFKVSGADLMPVLDAMRLMGFGGVNLTIPLKRRAFEGLSRLEECARRLGAVNTVSFDAEGMRGSNTDGVGFLRALEESLGLTPRGRRILVLGCGGAGRAVAITCALSGAEALWLANRTAERTSLLADEIAQLAPACKVETLSNSPAVWTGAARAADLIVQCTSTGLNVGDAPLLDSDAFLPGQALYDLVYVAPLTPIMAAARAAGATVANGLGMLLHQGAASFNIWTGREPDMGAMRRALESELY